MVVCLGEGGRCFILLIKPRERNKFKRRFCAILLNLFCFLKIKKRKGLVLGKNTYIVVGGNFQQFLLWR